MPGLCGTWLLSSSRGGGQAGGISVTDRRRDWAEKISTRLVKEHDLIVVEELNTPAMVRNPRRSQTRSIQAGSSRTGQGPRPG